MGLTLTNNAPTLTMSSREIAELTGKDHFNVLIDIRSMMDALQVDHLSFQAMSPDNYGRLQPVFNLPHRETMILLTGYSVPMRAKVVDRWKELEAQAAPAFAIPQTMGQALALAAQQWELAAVKSLA